MQETQQNQAPNPYPIFKKMIFLDFEAKGRPLSLIWSCKKNKPCILKTKQQNKPMHSSLLKRAYHLRSTTWCSKAQSHSKQSNSFVPFHFGRTRELNSLGNFTACVLQMTAIFALVTHEVHQREIGQNIEEWWRMYVIHCILMYVNRLHECAYVYCIYSVQGYCIISKCIVQVHSQQTWCFKKIL